MLGIGKSLEVEDKLAILSQDSKYDLACACGTSDSEHRYRSKDGKWIYPVVLPDGRRTFLFKTLVSNVCVNNCKYCPLRAGRDQRRCTLGDRQLVDTFLDYYRRRLVSGLFLSSGVVGSPDQTMERINSAAAMLRQRQFKGYIHLKVIPGASDAAIEEAVRLANAVSLNIETPGEKHFQKVCTTKNYLDDIIRPMKLISNLTAHGNVGQTTQFVVGASDETDHEIVSYSWGLYKRLGLNRVYFSAYQRGIGEADIPGESQNKNDGDMLTREHRLYQADWLIRKYGFNENEIPFEASGNLSLKSDPKEIWASKHPEFFPIDINRADKFALLRVPGLGLTTVSTILKARKDGVTFRSIEQISKLSRRLTKADRFLKFGYNPSRTTLFEL